MINRGQTKSYNKIIRKTGSSEEHKMGLRRKSISMPKLFSKENNKESFDTIKILHMAPDNLPLNDKWEKSQIVQMYSGKAARNETKTTNITAMDQQQYLLQSSLDSSTMKKIKNPRSTNKHGFSERIKGMFNALFSMDGHNVEDVNSHFHSDLSSSFNASQSVQKNAKATIRHSKSLPDLQQQATSGTKLSFQRQKSFVLNWPRKLRQRKNRAKTERQHSYVSSSCESSPEIHPRSKDRRLKLTKPIGSNELINLMTGNSSLRRDSTNLHHDNSPSSSPSSFGELSRSNEHVFFDRTPEQSPTITKPNHHQIFHADMGKMKIEKIIGGDLKSKRKMLKGKRSEYDYQGYHQPRGRKFLPRSFSECSDNADGERHEEQNGTIISNASLAAQRRRHIFAANKSKSVGFYAMLGNPNDVILGSSKEPASVENSKLSCSEKQNEIFYNIIRRSLHQTLRQKTFHRQNTKIWCKEIAELIKNKIEFLTGGVYKVAVQIFIGAVEEEGISSATMCNMNSNTDNFTIGSFRNSSLFALASVLAIDFREISLPAKSFQNKLYSRLHENWISNEKKNIIKNAKE